MSQSERALGWTLLFNGSDMSQWRTYKSKGTQGWVVENGEMIATGTSEQNADIISIDTFSNFELSLEWNISAEGNSGIFFNVNEKAQLNFVYESGPEYQLIDDAGYPADLKGWQKTGANYGMHGPIIENINPQGEWNHSRLIVDDGYVQHWLNDRLVVKYFLWTEDWSERIKDSKWKDYPAYGKYKSGHLALQDHGNQIRFRNIKIRRI